MAPFKRSKLLAAYNGRYADVVFVVGREDDEVQAMRRFPATRALFAMASDVFEAMLCSHAGESAFKDSGEVRIVDVSPEAFDQLCRHVHQLELALSVDSVFEVLRAADKYELLALMNECKRFVKKTVEEASDLQPCVHLLERCVTLRTQYGPHPDAVLKLMSVIQDRLADDDLQVLEGDLAGRLEPSHVRALLTSSRIFATEEAVWNAILVWATKRESACNEDRTHLARELFGLVRFNDMQKEFFVTEVMSSGLLDKDDVITALAHFVHPTAVRAVNSTVPGRSWATVKVSKCHGVSISGRTIAGAATQQNSWQSAVFFKTSKHDFQIEVMLRTAVSASFDSPRFMLGFLPTPDIEYYKRNGQLCFLSEDTLKYVYQIATDDFAGESLELWEIGDLPRGSRLIMTHSRERLSFRLKYLEQGQQPQEFSERHASVNPGSMPPRDYVPCLLLWGRTAVDVVDVAVNQPLDWGTDEAE